MKRAPRTWLLPTAFVAYVALASGGHPGGPSTWLAWFAPVGVFLGLRWVAGRAEASKLATSVESARLAVVGLCLYFAAAPGAAESAAVRAASGVAQGMLTAATLLAVAHLSPPPGLLQGHPAARSLDAMALSVVLWTTATGAALLRAVAPDAFPLDPLALDTAYLFGALGSLLLLCASLGRTRFLRGLELGASDRARAGLALALCGALVGAGSGFVRMETADRVAGATLVCTSVGILIALSAPDAARVARTVRAFVALLLLGTPAALGGAWLLIQTEEHEAPLAFGLAIVSMIVGLVAQRAARPLAPEGSRWLVSLTEAMEAALHPEPDMALRAALIALRKAEPTSPTRPEVFRFDPPGMLSVDIAGYLSEKSAETPSGVVDTALDEPHRTLRLETLMAAQVRIPRVRPLVTWFEAHRAKSATVLTDEAGPLGLLVLPRGVRKSSLTIEECELLARVARRLSGLISVTASLERARSRELDFQEQARAADARAADLGVRLDEQQRSDRIEAEARVAILRAAAHGPTSQIKRQELDEHATGPRLRLKTPLGVDPLPWAAHAHLARSGTPRPMVILDASEPLLRTSQPWSKGSDTTPWKRAREGTLVILHPAALPEALQLRLAEALEDAAPDFIVTCSAGADRTLPRLERQLDGPQIDLPTLADRGEDIQALIINELSQLGVTDRGTPLGIERAALYRLVQRRYPGNDAELRGLLASAAAISKGPVITLADLDALAENDDSELPPEVKETRSRARLAPRSRRR